MTPALQGTEDTAAEGWRQPWTHLFSPCILNSQFRQMRLTCNHWGSTRLRTWICSSQQEVRTDKLLLLVHVLISLVDQLLLPSTSKDVVRATLGLKCGMDYATYLCSRFSFFQHLSQDVPSL